jgi:hypothetical protein
VKGDSAATRRNDSYMKLKSVRSKEVHDARIGQHVDPARETHPPERHPVFRQPASTGKTLEKVETFAQKQLNMFLEGMMKESPDLKRNWKNGHPFVAKAAINRETLGFEIQIIEKEPGKF